LPHKWERMRTFALSTLLGLCGTLTFSMKGTMSMVLALKRFTSRRVTYCEYRFGILEYPVNNSSSIMPGGVPHWVLGTSNAICIGRHFYGTSTIRFSVISIVHTFLLSGALTNEDHHETRTLLYQLMVFWSTRLDKTDVDGGFEQ
jgi:hypothetical protein